MPGHWEGDLLSRANNTHIAMLVERRTRFAMLIKVEGKDTATVVDALTMHVRRLPAQIRRSLTWDRGKEMADRTRFTLAADVKVYFCDPRSPGQRGRNENTIGLLHWQGYSTERLNSLPGALIRPCFTDARRMIRTC